MGSLLELKSIILVVSFNRSAIAAGLHGYSAMLVGLLMAVFSAKENWYGWLLFPVAIMSMMW